MVVRRQLRKNMCVVCIAVVLGAAYLSHSTVGQQANSNLKVGRQSPGKVEAEKNIQNSDSYPELVSDVKFLKNVWRVSSRVYSGGEPSGKEAFDELRTLGVLTIVSVDGALPEVDIARRSGLRYIHIPIGYDGISAEAQRSLFRVAKDVTGIIYIHCHHGKHRGPAAAGIFCQSDDGRSAKDARLILEKAGTGAQYSGLWRDVEGFRAPARGDKLPELVSIAKIDALPSAMVRIDRAMEILKQLAINGWKSDSKQKADTSAGEQALLVREDFHEIVRITAPSTVDAVQTQWMLDAEKLAASLESQLQQNKPNEAKRTLAELEAACQTCHARFRN